MPNEVPEFGQLVEYVTEGPVFHRVALAQHSLDSVLTLEAVQADYAKVALIGRSALLDVSELDALKVGAGSVYHQDVIEHEVTSTDPAVIVDALIAVRERPEWRAGLDVAPPEVVFYVGNLYRCVIGHRAQADWTPDITPNLWTKYYEPSVVPAWAQPVGSSDAWPLGAQVTHGGHTWQSTIHANVWEPGAVGSEALWTDLTPVPPTTEWVSGEQGLVIGDRRTYQGNIYEVRQALGINIWTPNIVPALWLLIGPV